MITEGVIRMYGGEVQKALRHVLYVKYEMKDQDLFDKAYGYIAQYY